MKMAYAQPRLVEYGRIEQLTLGAGGSAPDYVAVPQPGGGVVLIDDNTNCTVQANETSCLIVDGS